MWTLKVNSIRFILSEETANGEELYLKSINVHRSRNLNQKARNKKLKHPIPEENVDELKLNIFFALLNGKYHPFYGCFICAKWGKIKVKKNDSRWQFWLLFVFSPICCGNVSNTPIVRLRLYLFHSFVGRFFSGSYFWECCQKMIYFLVCEFC